ncbi:hypothetical protein KBB12_02635 [Candidatus Woesebacteria bacterium]|nr:hypothetical protein [Candidatus Woesebacteria bacterium]
MKKELRRFISLALVTALPVISAGCDGKRDTPAIPTPVPVPCLGSTAGVDWKVDLGTRSVIPLPDVPPNEGYVGSTDRKLTVLCDEFGNTIYEGLTERLVLTSATPSPSPEVTPTPKVRSATPTLTPTYTPTSEPVRLDTPINYLPPDCAVLAQGGWVDQTDTMPGGCQDSTYYRVCGPAEDTRCMYDLEGFDNSAVRRIIPYGDGTELQCDDGSTRTNVSSGDAWNACMEIYQQAAGEPPSHELPLGSQTIFGCIFPGMEAEMAAKGFLVGRVAVHINRDTDLAERGLGAGRGVLCELAPQK